jgi:hypothetical protein
MGVEHMMARLLAEIRTNCQMKKEIKTNREEMKTPI